MSKVYTTKVLAGLSVGIALLVIFGVVGWFYQNTKVDNSKESFDSTTSTPEENSEVKEENATVEKKPAFDDQALQTVLDEWLKTIPSSSRAAVVLMDENGGELASVSSQEAFFTASIYKLYVAYEGYRMVDAGTYDSATSYLNGKTLGECLDLMIRESNSPCAEKMWNGIGKDVLDTKMKEYGLKNTSMVGLSTTAEDAAIMLARIQRGEGLSKESQAKFLESMKTQIYRDTLNRGFSNTVTVYNKIGFNGQLEYHDTAIVKLADGRVIIVSVLTSEVGTKNIISLAQKLEAAF
jgi:beta-lactamase class A